VLGVSASGAELTTLLHAGEFLVACTANPDGGHHGQQASQQASQKVDRREEAR
jgi:hypothetical protein